MKVKMNVKIKMKVKTKMKANMKVKVSINQPPLSAPSYLLALALLIVQNESESEN